MALIDDAIAFAKVEEDKEAVRPLLDAAEAYVTNAVEEKDQGTNEQNPLFCLAVKMLFAHWYDNREPVGKADKIAYGLQCIMTQLQNGGGGTVAGG